MDTQLADRILAAVSRIPAGRVATYGDVAADAGGNSPRFAGWVLSNLADGDLPWHRVLPANGRPVPRLAAEQLRTLAAEGVLAIDGRVPMRRYRVAEASDRRIETPPRGTDQSLSPIPDHCERFQVR